MPYVHRLLFHFNERGCEEPHRTRRKKVTCSKGHGVSQPGRERACSMLSLEKQLVLLPNWSKTILGAAKEGGVLSRWLLFYVPKRLK